MQLFTIRQPRIEAKEYRLEDFGAVGDGLRNNSSAFYRAIEAAHKTGGRVTVPNGIFLTGPIEMKSGVDLHLSDNATIIFIHHEREYPLYDSGDCGKNKRIHKPMISMHGIHDAAITGRGTIDGNGLLWHRVEKRHVATRHWKNLKMFDYGVYSEDKWYPSEHIQRKYEKNVDTRPCMIAVTESTRILISDVRIMNSPKEELYLYDTSDVTVHGVNILSPYYNFFDDGLVIDASKRIHIHHCNFYTGGNSVVLKAQKLFREIDHVCRDVYIHDCHFDYGENAFVIGREIDGTVSGLFMENCTFVNSTHGIAIYGNSEHKGTVKNLEFYHLEFVNIRHNAFLLKMDDDGIGEDLPSVSDIVFRRCHNVSIMLPIHIEGFKNCPSAVRRLHFEKCTMGKWTAEGKNGVDTKLNLEFNVVQYCVDITNNEEVIGETI